jgi:hypothetical protein
MKLRSIRAVVFGACALASPVVNLAAQSAKVGIVVKAEAPDPVDVTKAVQFGKGTGMTRKDETLSGNAYRSQTADDQGKVKNNSGERQPNYRDAAFRK